MFARKSEFKSEIKINVEAPQQTPGKIGIKSENRAHQHITAGRKIGTKSEHHD
jgi:hypothetical protein